MKTKGDELRATVRAAEAHLETSRQRLADYERSCPHRWTEPVYDPIRIPGGHDPGDPPGTMGVDRRLPCSWGPTEKPRWRRTCTECGKVEYTERSKEEPAVKKPVF